MKENNKTLEEGLKEVVKNATNRFCGWKLPDDFNPDCGISFKREYNENTDFAGKYEPIGTNLFTATQAEQMIVYILENTLTTFADKIREQEREQEQEQNLLTNAKERL